MYALVKSTDFFHFFLMVLVHGPYMVMAVNPRIPVEAIVRLVQFHSFASVPPSLKLLQLKVRFLQFPKKQILFEATTSYTMNGLYFIFVAKAEKVPNRMTH